MNQKQSLGGEKNFQAKLTEEQVKEIRSLYQKSVPIWKIAQLTGAKRTNVWNIVHRYTWAHI